MNFPDWSLRWMGLVFAGYGVLLALIVNRFVFDGPGWGNVLVVVVLTGLLGAIGHRIGQKRLRDGV